MNSVNNGDTFKGSRDGIMQLVVVVTTTGTATIQALAGSKTGTAVDFTDNSLSASGIITFHAVSDQWFKIVLTGDAQAWLAG